LRVRENHPRGHHGRRLVFPFFTRHTSS
jgi:hypothetical protein